MKQAAKVFIILGMIFGALWIVPLIVGSIALSRLNTAQTKSELTGVGVCTLLFCNLIGGILILCLSDEDLIENRIKVQQSAAPVTYKPAPSQPAEKTEPDIIANIEKLQGLKEQGLITPEEFEILKKREISNHLGK